MTPRNVRRSRIRGLRTAVALLATVSALGCTPSEREEPVQHRDAVELASDKMTILTGPVGEEKFRVDATYVLVNARNTSERDLLVTLRGKLVDGSGGPLGKLHPQILRIPAGGERMFSLVARDQKAWPAATAAEIEIAEAVDPGYPPSVIVTDGSVTIDQGRAVVQGNVVNTTDSDVAVIVIFGFYGADGRPMKQSSTKYELAPNAKRGAMVVGPTGSTASAMFAGDYTHCEPRYPQRMWCL